jgi:hypothetical protein
MWSSIGLTLFITVITYQLYFPVSAYWNFVNVSGLTASWNWGNKIPVYLTNSNNTLTPTFGVTSVGAFKCALANVIAFAAIIGRAGLL